MSQDMGMVFFLTLIGIGVGLMTFFFALLDRKEQKKRSEHIEQLRKIFHNPLL